MGKLRRLRINKGERSSAFAGATSGAVVGGASGAGVGAAIGLAMIPIAPISVPIGFLVGGLIGGACGAPSGAAVAVKRGRNSVEELNVGDARRYGDHKTADMVRLRDDVELPAQAEDPSTYATATTLYEKMDAPSSSSASSSIPEEEGQFSAWLNPMGLSAPATTPSYAYTSSSTSATSAYGREDPAERLLRSKTTSSSSRYAGTDEYSQESNRGRRATSHKTKSFDQEDDVDYDDDGEAGLERRRGSSRRGTSSSSSQRYASSQNDYHRPGNLVPVLPPQPATDVHLRHYDPQEELSRRFDSWERRDRDRELERQEQERRDEFYAKQLQLQYDRESGGSSSSGGSRPRSSASSGSTRKTREVSRKKEVDPEKTLDSLWGSEPFY